MLLVKTVVNRSVEIGRNWEEDGCWKMPVMFK
jgi:hypothetical protein